MYALFGSLTTKTPFELGSTNGPSTNANSCAPAPKAPVDVFRDTRSSSVVNATEGLWSGKGCHATRVAPTSCRSTSMDEALVEHLPGKLYQTLQRIVERDQVRTKEHWRPENRGALVHRGRANDSSLSGQLLYAATHVDKTQRRNIANLIAKERLYRRLFCGQSQFARAPRTAAGRFVIRRADNEVIGANGDGETDTLDESLVNGDLGFIKYRDESRELNLETLCVHIEQLIDLGYSLTYIFAYLSYLRRKYRSAYPKFGNQTSAFYRTLIDNYERKVLVQPRIGTDEIYTCEDELYETMYDLANEYYFSTNIVAQITSDRTIFVYVFLFMYYTGKRLSELSLIGREQIATLLKFDALVIRIPKCKKLGRIVLRGYDENMRERFKRFLARSLELFDMVKNARKSKENAVTANPDNLDDSRASTYHDIPFDQFAKRRLLDQNFAQLYARASRKLLGRDVHKPRGLSLHSLRRYRAATMFAQGKEIDHIRECLDHSSVKVTNTYINRHLMRSYRKHESGIAREKNNGEEKDEKEENRRRRRRRLGDVVRETSRQPNQLTQEQMAN